MSERATQTAAALRATGVEHLFGVTGSGFSLTLIEAFEAAGGTYFAASHEAAAAMMAGASARVRRSIGAALTIKGPGFANAMPGQLSNLYEGWPVISISEAYAAERAGRAHKLLDQRRASAQFVKAYGSLGDPAGTISDLTAIALEETPGPVHLDVPARDEPHLDRLVAASAPAHVDTPFGGVLTAARRPVVIAGSLAVRRGWASRLAALELPVFTTVAAKGLIDETLPQAAGIYTGDGQEQSVERQMLPSADLVIGIGLRSAEVLTPCPFGVPLLLIDEIDGAAGGFDAPVRSADAIDEIWAALANRRWGLDEVAVAHGALKAHLMRDRWLPAGVFMQLQEALPAARLVSDTGLFCTAAEHIWRSRTPLDMLASANGRFMGTGIPMAIGAAVADRSHPVICAVGDGGLPVGASELRLVIDERLPLLIVFMTDGGYGSVAGPAGFAARSARATAMRSPSWWRLIEAAGIPSCRATDLASFDRALAAWDQSSPRLIEAAFDAPAYARSTAGVR